MPHQAAPDRPWARGLLSAFRQVKRARRGEGPDRPGWPAPDSSVPDLGELIRHTGLAGCAVVGLSGGGPTALACGLLLAGQVTAVATVAGAAPLVPRDPRQPPDRLMIKTARRSQAAACALFAAILRAGRIRPEQVLRRFAALLARPDADLLRDEAGLRDGFLGDLRHGGTSTWPAWRYRRTSGRAPRTATCPSRT